MRDLVTTISRRPKLTLAGLLLLLAAFYGYSLWLQWDLPKQMPSIIGRQLKMELTSEAATAYLHVSEPNSKPTAEESKAFDAAKTAIDQLQIDSLAKRGWGSRVIAKVKFHMDGVTLPDGQDTRYYRLRFSWLTGWRLPAQVQERQYQTAWFYLLY